MPDPDRKTISASQAPALFNASPYITRWMLYQFLKGADIDTAATDRMRWGTKMQPLLLEQAQADLKLDITPNFNNDYVRAADAPLGATRDATVWCPDRGKGAVETKCCFDYGTWMRDWAGGQKPPRHVELQLQQQLLVGDGSNRFGWGVIAVWIAGEMKYFERTLDMNVGDELIKAATDMNADVRLGKEPDPFGAATELPILAKLFPVVKGKELDMRAHEHGPAIAQIAADYKNWKGQENFYGKAATDARGRILAIARDAETLLLPGATVKLSMRTMREHVRKASTFTAIKIELTGEEDNDETQAD